MKAQDSFICAELHCNGKITITLANNALHGIGFERIFDIDDKNIEIKTDRFFLSHMSAIIDVLE